MKASRIVAVALAALLAAAFVLLRTPRGPRSLRVFEPDRMAHLELQLAVSTSF
ncbi:MAG TPA: hypothetical protein VF993_10060 [Myxococcales bacterium]